VAARCGSRRMSSGWVLGHSDLAGLAGPFGLPSFFTKKNHSLKFLENKKIRRGHYV
jgi:hypothetical protein